MQDPVQPTREQLKVLALNTPLYISGSHSDNLYLQLQSKFPKLDVHANAADRQQFEYYLRVCGGYYADKMREPIATKGAANAAAMQTGIDRMWRAFRVTQLTLQGRGRHAHGGLADGDSSDDTDSEDQLAAASANTSSVHQQQTESETRLSQVSDLLSDSTGQDVLMPNTEQLIPSDTQQPQPDGSDSYVGDDDDDIENELEDDGASIVQLLLAGSSEEGSEDPLIVDLNELRETPPDTDSQSQRETQMDTMEPNATSTQTQR